MPSRSNHHSGVPRAWLRAIAGSALCWLAQMCGAATAWPAIPIPPDARTQAMGDGLVVNGLPMRSTLFESRMPMAQALAWYRKTLGQGVVANPMGGQVVLGKGQGEFYVTVQLGPTAHGSKGVVGVSHVRGGTAGLKAMREESAALVAGLPLGTHVLRNINSRDGAQQSKQWLLGNRASEQLNVDLLKASMQRRGYGLEREWQTAKLPGTHRQGRNLMFSGDAGQAMASVVEDADQRVTLLINFLPKPNP